MFGGTRILIYVLIYSMVSRSELKAAVDKDIQIDYITVKSNVSMRFSEVTVSGQIRNLGQTDKETNFDITLPKSAFITGFFIVVGGVKSVAEVKENAAALDEYKKALDDNVTAGFVSQQSALVDDFDRDRFSIRVNIAPNSTASIELKYQELIERHNNRYQQKLYINPNSKLNAIDVMFEITESKAFKSFQYKTPFTTTMVTDEAQQRDTSGNYKKMIQWSPETEDVLSHDFGENDAFDVVYDLEQLEEGGELVMNNNGGFTHFFSTICDPNNVMPKKIMIVIDISGSMKGIPIIQVRTAMFAILNQLKPNELFNMLFFARNVKMWRPTFAIANQTHIQDAKRFLNTSLNAAGSTNMHDAMVRALDIFQQDKTDTENLYGQLIILLSDGEPTAGQTNEKVIRETIKSKNYYNVDECCRTSIFTVAFGSNSKKAFLMNIALENDGVAKIIKDPTDTTNHEVLLDFFGNIENPYLRNVNFSYSSGGVALPRANTTRSVFPLFDCGGEIIVSGWTSQGATIQPRIQARGITGNLTLRNVARKNITESQEEILNKLIVYKRVKELLENLEKVLDKDEEERIKMKVTSLALEHSLVTPLTSMVVTSYRKKTGPIQVQDRMAAIKMATNAGNHARNSGGGNTKDIMVPDPSAERNDDNTEFYGNLENFFNENENSCFVLQSSLIGNIVFIAVSFIFMNFN